MRGSIIVCLAMIIALTGCASTKAAKVKAQPDKDPAVQQQELQENAQAQEVRNLKAQVDILKMQMKVRDEEIRDMRRDISEAKRLSSSRAKTYIAEPGRSKTAKATTGTKYDSKKIQQALSNAGYYAGAIDGKIGKITAKGLKEFQAAHGLKADGIVGKKTWEKLKEYLDIK